MAAMPAGEAELGLEPETAAPAMPGAASGAMGSILRRLADFLLPPVCISCRTRIGSHGLLCGACFARIDFIAPPLCDRLGVPLPFEAGEKLLSAAAIAFASSLRPRAGRCALFGHHARAYPELQISGPA